MYELIATDSELDDVVAAASSAPRYALDTEFHRERTYYPQAALVQLAWDDRIALIDPLAVDLAPLAKLLDSPAVCVLHAGAQDLEVLDLKTGTIPSVLFDTQIAGGFLGSNNSSLAALLDRFLGVTIPKGDRLTDWLKRPLTEDQLRYAASDVEYLLQLTDRLTAELDELGRTQWALDESAAVRERPRNRRDPEAAVLRIKEARSLKGRAYSLATAVAAWRERRAAQVDMPVRQVLPDLAVVAVAQQAPTEAGQLRGLRGVERRHLRSGVEDELVALVRETLENLPAAIQQRPTRAPELPKHLRPVVTLVTAWIAQLARDNQLDPALLATRADVEALLKGDTETRVRYGWRAELVGGPIEKLVSGEAAVAFDGDGRLVLEARSRQSLELG